MKKKADFIIRERTSRSGRVVTVVEVNSNRPVPPARDSGHVKTIVIRKAHPETRVVTQ